MCDAADAELLERFTGTESEEAFATLVGRYINLVYSTARRHTANPQQAEEITQAVFILLARKAPTLPQRIVLSGWLYHTTRLTAANFQRTEWRRIRREQEAYMQSTLEDHRTDATWRELSPLLDEAMTRLGRIDRDAIVLRYFENKNLQEVGAALGLQERAAQKRVVRSLEKLRAFFARRGVTLSTAIIAGAVSANAVQAAPAGLTLSAVAAAKGSAATVSTLTLVKGALSIMAWTKAKTTIVGAMVVLLAVGTTTIAVKEVQKHRRYPWQIENADTRILERVPPQVMIVPTIFAPTQRGFNISNNKMLGMGQTVSSLLGAAYQLSRYRVVYLTTPPAGNYDFIANLRTGEEANRAALRREIAERFHLVGRIETRENDVLVLTVNTRNAPGLKPNPSKSSDANSDSGAGYWRASNLSSGNMAGRCERYFKTPVIDRTGLAGRFDVDLKWEEQIEGQNPEAFKQVVLDQLGLELVPGREPVEMLVVEKVK